MASKKNFSITTPRGSVLTEITANGSVQARLEWNPSFVRTKSESFSKAQEFVDSECLRYMNPLTPRRTGMVWIYSAFREAYGIDLQSVPYMHWWEFQALFIGLPDNTEIKQRILYRNTDLRDIKDKDERKRVKKIQEAVALKKKKRRKMTDYEIGDMFA